MVFWLQGATRFCASERHNPVYFHQARCVCALPWLVSFLFQLRRSPINPTFFYWLSEVEYVELNAVLTPGCKLFSPNNNISSASKGYNPAYFSKKMSQIILYFQGTYIEYDLMTIMPSWLQDPVISHKMARLSCAASDSKFSYVALYQATLDRNR